MTLLAISHNKIVILLIINLILFFCRNLFGYDTCTTHIYSCIPSCCNSSRYGPNALCNYHGLNLSIGLCTPPVGSVLFLGAEVAGTSIDKVIKPLLPLFVAMIVALFLVTYIPVLTLWLPGLFGV